MRDFFEDFYFGRLTPSEQRQPVTAEMRKATKELTKAAGISVLGKVEVNKQSSSTKYQEIEETSNKKVKKAKTPPIQREM